MGAIARSACLIGFCTVVAAAASLPAQQPRDAVPVSAEVAGRVLDTADRPLAGATVHLSNHSTWTATVSTSYDGHFRFRSVPTGRFVVRAEKAGYLQDRSAGEGIPADSASLEIQPGAPPAPLTLVLRRAGTVTGRLLRPDGRPAAGVPMTLAARRGLSGDLVSSDTDGTFRITGVYPGEYRVAAIYFAGQAGLPAGYHAPVFHPGTVDPSKATWFRVDAEQELDVGTFQIVASPATTISGVVHGLDGSPVAGARVHALTETGFPAPQAYGPTEGDGRFTLTHATPGPYTLWVSLAARTEGLLEGVALQDIVVAREDVSDVTIRLAPAGRVSGRVEFAGAGGRTPDPRSVRVSVTREGYIPSEVPITATGTFVRDLFPGRYTFSAFVSDDGIRWSLASARAGGVDLPGNGVVLEHGSIVSDIVLTLSDHVVR